jgi:tetratricopeptide (TPR) repeat protein
MSRRKAKRNILTQKAKEKANSAQTKVLSSHRHVLVLLTSLFLIVLILAAFEQIRNHAFINLDDNKYITENRLVQSGLTLGGLTWAFTATHAANWHPLTWLSHMLDCQLYGLNPSGHHLTNLIFHIASTLLLFLVLRRMTGTLWKSCFVAALFALHPLHVESVAWVAERKDVLSAFFWMLTMWAYIRYVERPKLQRYLLALLFFALGLMSKPMLVTLPFVLLLLDYWPLGRFQLIPSSMNPKSLRSKPKNNSGQISMVLRLIREKAPFFLLSALSSILTIFAQQKGGAMVSLEHYPFESRVANALVSYASYIGKMIWPSHLSIFYPYQEILPLWKVVGAGLLLTSVSVLVIRVVHKLPYLAVGWFWYIGTLIPVIGLVQVGSQAMADRYTYVPLIGLFVMVAWSAPDILAGWRHRRVVLSISAGILLSILMIATRLQVPHWQNSIMLFGHSIDVTSNNYLAHNNLGSAFMRQGKIQEAIAHFTEALRISPDDPEVHYNLGVVLQGQGKLQEAIIHFAQAVRIKPDYAIAHNNLGVALVVQGKIQEAIAHFAKAVQAKPDYAEAHINLGFGYLTIGDKVSALEEYKVLKKLNPYLADQLYQKIPK